MAAAAPATAASVKDSRPSHAWTFLRYGPTDLAPPDFFNVKEEITPKATVNATMAFTALAYVPTLAIFVALFVAGSNTVNTDTKVTTRDLSLDQSSSTEYDWSCSMISKVTESVTLGSNSSFGLNAVLQSRGECRANLGLHRSVDESTGSFDSCKPTWGGSSTEDMSLFSYPIGVGVGGSTNGTAVYVTDYTNRKLYKFEKGLKIELMDSAHLTSSTMFGHGVAVDSRSGSVYVSDYSLKVFKYDESTGMVSTLVDTTELKGPTGVALDSSGAHLYVADYDSAFSRDATGKLLKVDTTSGNITVLMDTLSSPQGVAVDSSGNVYVSDSTSVYKYHAASGNVTVVMDDTHLAEPKGVVVVPDGVVYVVDSTNDALYRLDEDLGNVTKVMGSEHLATPKFAAADERGFVYVTDAEITKVYRYDPTTGAVDTLQLHSGSAGWFRCEDETMATYPATTADALGACALNGITWSMDFVDGCFFSSSDAGAYYTSVLAASGDGCDISTRVSICEYVSDLPPYMCERSRLLGMADVIGTAAANSELFYILLVSVLARFLWLFQPKGGQGEGSGGDDQDLGDLELAQANPMRAASSTAPEAVSVDEISKEVQDPPVEEAYSAGAFRQLQDQVASLQAQLDAERGNNAKLAALEREVQGLLRSSGGQSTGQSTTRATMA